MQPSGSRAAPELRDAPRSRPERGAAPAAARGERLAPEPSLSGPLAMLRYAREPLRRFEAARALSDRAVAFTVLGSNYIVLFDPQAIEQVLVARYAEFHKDKYTRDLRRVLGTGLLTNEDEPWRRRRKLMAPSFQRSEIAAYGPAMTSAAEEFVKHCTPGAVIDVHAAMMQLTLDVLVRALFGTRIRRGAEVGELLDRLMPDYLPIAVSARMALPEWFPVPSRRRLQRAREQLDSVLLELIEQRGRLEAPPKDDLLARLMRARDEEGGLTDAALRDEAMTLFLAGHETTALALTYALRLLSLHPGVEQRLIEEQREVLAGRSPQFSDIPALRLTRAVIDEALRLFPPAWALGRCALSDLEVCGIAVPAGTMLLMSPWIMQRDPRFFERPEAFEPERWLGPPPARFAYFPFGAGPRVCIGQHFAVAEAVLLLSTLLGRLRFVLQPGALRLLAAVTLRPRDPVLMRVDPR